MANDVDKVEDLAEEELDGVRGVSASVKSPVLDNVVNHVAFSFRVHNRLLKFGAKIKWSKNSGDPNTRHPKLVFIQILEVSGSGSLFVNILKYKFNGMNEQELSVPKFLLSLFVWKRLRTNL